LTFSAYLNVDFSISFITSSPPSHIFLKLPKSSTTLVYVTIVRDKQVEFGPLFLRRLVVIEPPEVLLHILSFIAGYEMLLLIDTTPY